MVLSLPGSPTRHQEKAYYWWVQQLHNQECDYCETPIQYDKIHLSNSGIYCSELCWHMEESTYAWRHGLVGQDSGREIR